MAGRISIRQADITTLAVDAIVNAANETLLGGGGVDGAIHDAAGPGLLEACRKLGGCATGDAKITPGFDLPARYVIHAVGPIWRGGHRGEPEQLAGCYRRSFDFARDHHLCTLAFPAISCGAYSYPMAEAVAIAVREVRAGLAADQRIEQVIFTTFDADMTAAYRQGLSG